MTSDVKEIARDFDRHMLGVAEITVKTEVATDGSFVCEVPSPG